MTALERRLKEIGTVMQPILLLVIRIIWGGFFIKSGWIKIMELGQVAEYFGSLGIVIPSVMAVLVALIHLAGGTMLFLGFFTRIAAAALGVTMAVAFWTAHHSALINAVNKPSDFFCAVPFLFLFVCLILFTFGAGKYSITDQ